MEALGGEEVQLLLILDLGTRWGWVVSVTPRPRFYPRGKDPPVPIVQEAGWASEPVWTQRLEEKSFAPAGDRTLIARSIVRHHTAWTYPTPFCRSAGTVSAVLADLNGLNANNCPLYFGFIDHPSGQVPVLPVHLT
jgi:hypothetical protein